MEFFSVMLNDFTELKKLTHTLLWKLSIDRHNNTYFIHIKFQKFQYMTIL